MITPLELKKEFENKKIALREYLRRIYNLALYFKRRADKDITGAFSRQFFEDIIKIEHARVVRNPNSKMSLAIIDIDFFKKYNDTYGHRAGDELLKNLADLMKKEFRTSDIVCRYGGEEFVAILSGSDGSQAMVAAKRVREKIKKKLKITVSIGICQDSAKFSIEQLIKNADFSLYRAKKQGRNREQLFTKNL